MMYSDLFENEVVEMVNVLPRDGDVYYYPNIVDAVTADTYLAQCIQQLSWENDRAFMFGKEIITKRKIAWYADQPVTYKYSGYTKVALAWPEVLRGIKHQVEDRCGDVFNSCLCNFYSGGDEGMGWHSDDEKELVNNGVIGAFTLGGERKFSFKHRTSGESVSLNLAHGSLLLMKGSTQKHWLHSLPKTKKNVAPRVSLTFRQMRF